VKLHAAYYVFHALLIEGTLDSQAAALKHMSIDHCCFDILVSEEFLNCADVVAALQEMGGEGMTEGVATDWFVCDTGQAGGGVHGFLKAAFIGMVAAHHIGAWVDGDAFGREDVLPGPFARGVGVFLFKGIGQIDGSVPILDILLVDLLNAGKMFFQGEDEALGKHGNAVFLPFTVAGNQAVLFEVDVLDSQANTFNEAQAGAVENFCHELVNAGEGVDDAQGFAFGKDGGEALGLLGANGSNAIERLVENFAIEKDAKRGAEGLVSLAPPARAGVGGGSDFALSGEVGDKDFDFGNAHVFGVALLVK